MGVGSLGLHVVCSLHPAPGPISVARVVVGCEDGLLDGFFNLCRAQS